MNYKKYLMKLGTSGSLLIAEDGNNLEIKIRIKKEQLIENLNNLAYEIHLEIETQAEIAYETKNKRIKHSKIFIKDPIFVIDRQLKELKTEFEAKKVK